jgi:hypothetical protein
MEGPVPHLDTRLCMLLSITTLAVANIIEETNSLYNESELNSHVKENEAAGNLHKELMLSLQTLGDYESLLVPPPCIIPAADQAATKAAMFISGLNISNGYAENVNRMNYGMSCSQNSCFKYIYIPFVFLLMTLAKQVVLTSPAKHVFLAPTKHVVPT